MEYLLSHLATAVCAISGALAARGKQLDLFGVVVLALVTALGGGTIRDVLTGEIPLVFRRQIYLYATASLCGASVFVLLQPMVAQPTLRLVAAGSTLLLRLAAIQWRIRLPMFKAKET